MQLCIYIFLLAVFAFLSKNITKPLWISILEIFLRKFQICRVYRKVE